MLKKWFAELLAIAISASSLSPLHGEDLRFPPAGREIIADVEISYQKGEYDNFLQQLHEQYERAGKVGVLSQVFQNAQKKALDETTAPKIFEKIKELKQERNRRLLEAISDDPNTEIAKKVDAVVYSSINPKYTDVLKEFHALKNQIPQTAEGSVENKISAIEIEYHMKSLLLDIANHHSQSSLDELDKKKIALILEKFDGIEDVIKSSSEMSWTEKIQNVRQATLLRKAEVMDLNVLIDLATEKISAINAIEEKVKSIMMDYLQKKRIYFGQYRANHS